MVLYSHRLVFLNSWRMLLGQCVDGIEGLCGSFDNETSAEAVSKLSRSLPRQAVLLYELILV